MMTGGINDWGGMSIGPDIKSNNRGDQSRKKNNSPNPAPIHKFVKE